MDPSWEFQAPQFVDFNNLGAAGTEPEDEKADEFFNVDMESGENWVPPVEEPQSLEVRDAPMATNPPEEEVKEEVKEAVKEEQKPRRPANLVTSWGKGKVEKVAAAARPAPRPETPKRRALRTAVTATIDKIRNSPKLPTFKRTPKRLGTNLPSPKPVPSRRRTSSAGSEVQRSLSKPSAALPKTPEVMRRYKAKVAEGARAGEAIARLVKPTSSSLQKAQPVIKQGLQPVKQPVMARPGLTMPKEFSFATGRPAVRAPTGADAPDFSRMLRSYTKPVPAAAPPQTSRPTQPQPFPRQERTRRHSADPNAQEKNYKSQAEQILRYQQATPDRFRSRPASREKTPRTRNRSASPAARLTVPATPVLATRGRSRPATVLSQAEREERELEENSRKQFKAAGVGESVPRYRHGEVEKKPCTIPQPFSLHGSMGRPAPRVEEEEAPVFTARPVPRYHTGVPDRKEHSLIVPQSPAFALKPRMAERQDKVRAAAIVETEQEPVVRARPAPHRGIPVSLPNLTRKMTQPEPFSFEQRDHVIQTRKEEKIQKIYDEEKAAREFHAKPVLKAVETGGRLPERQHVSVTKTEPFKMSIDERVESRLAKWQDTLAKELEEQRKATQFRATEARSLAIPPFVPKPSQKALSEISNFTLHSDRRAEERAQYELERTAKEASLEGARRQKEERRRRDEEEDVAKQRRAAVHKAQPVKHYRPLEVKPSSKPLTMPESPHLQAGKTGKPKPNSTFNQ